MGYETIKYERKHRPHPGERAAADPLASLVARQHGVVTRRQLVELGKSEGAIQGWLRRGRLHRIHRGVYALGHPVLTPEGRWMAAVLAGGEGAVLSHRSAAALWGIGVREGKAVEVSARRGRGTVAGVEVHRPRALTEREVTTRRGIRVTTLPRTLVDLADVAEQRELDRAIHEAQVTHSLGERALDQAAAHGRRGAGRLIRATRERELTRSELERRFLRLCKAAALPKPRVNDRIADLEVDLHWPDQRLVVETDGWTYHRTRRAFEHDRRRDQTLARCSTNVLRFTHRQITDEPEEVVATLRAALA